MQEMALKRLYFSKFSWGACAQTPLEVLAPSSKSGKFVSAPKISKPVRLCARLRHIIFSDGSSRFGQREPPLTEQIVNILGRYPDGGQILKVICKCNPQSAQKRVAN